MSPVEVSVKVNCVTFAIPLGGAKANDATGGGGATVMAELVESLPPGPSTVRVTV